MAIQGTRVGTPFYLSPELVQNQPYDFKVDIWAVGCVLYHLANLRPPFKAENLVALGRVIVKGRPRPLPSGYSRRLDSLINLLMEKDPRSRPTGREALGLLPGFVKARTADLGAETSRPAAGQSEATTQGDRRESPRKTSGQRQRPECRARYEAPGKATSKGRIRVGNRVAIIPVISRSYTINDYLHPPDSSPSFLLEEKKPSGSTERNMLKAKRQKRHQQRVIKELPDTLIAEPAISASVLTNPFVTMRKYNMGQKRGSDVHPTISLLRAIGSADLPYENEAKRGGERPVTANVVRRKAEAQRPRSGRTSQRPCRLLAHFLDVRRIKGGEEGGFGARESALAAYFAGANVRAGGGRTVRGLVARTTMGMRSTNGKLTINDLLQ